VTGPVSVSVPEGGVVPVDGIAAGSDCTVTEGPRPPVEDQSYEWLDPEFTVGDGEPTVGTEASFTIPTTGGAVVRVGFTNPIRQLLGVFSVQKVLDGPQRVTRADASYRSTWSCVLPGGSVADGTFDVTADGAPHLLALGLPSGTRCNAAEDLAIGRSAASDGDRAFRWGLPTLDINEVVIGENDTDVGIVRITNTVADVTTSATIAKVVDDPDGAAPTDTLYSGTVRCVAPDGTVTNSTWAVRSGVLARRRRRGRHRLHRRRDHSGAARHRTPVGTAGRFTRVLRYARGQHRRSNRPECAAR
jgi:hypothetical protein